MRQFAAVLIILAVGVSCSREKGQEPLRIGVTTLENEADRAARWEFFRTYFAKRMQRKVEIHDATDYAGVVEALKARRIDLAYVGAAAYASAWLTTRGKVRAIAGTLNEDGYPTYRSVIEVRADSPYRTVDDLKGKVLAFADPNSTSGYAAPSYFLREQGKDPAAFFKKTIFAGGHEGAILALVRGVCDGAATWSYGATRTNSARMAEKKMIPKGSTRVIWQSPEIPTTAWTVRTDTSQAEQHLWKKALIEFAKADPKAFAAVGKGRETGYVDIDPSAYDVVIRMVEFNQAQRRAR